MSSLYFCTMTNKIAVAGAGTMGSGIAMAAAQSGFDVILFDTNETVLEKARLAIRNNLNFLVEKQKITVEQSQVVFNRVLFSSVLNDCKADLVIEAIVEIAEAKTDLFNKLALINSSQTIFASNTSSLSISQLQQKIVQPQRVAGMHFFNPAQVMKLVEVVKGKQTLDAVAQTVYELCLQMKKNGLLAKPTHGDKIRFAPPLVITKDQIMEAVGIIAKSLKKLD